MKRFKTEVIGGSSRIYFSCFINFECSFINFERIQVENQPHKVRQRQNTLC